MSTKEINSSHDKENNGSQPIVIIRTKISQELLYNLQELHLTHFHQ